MKIVFNLQNNKFLKNKKLITFGLVGILCVCMYAGVQSLSIGYLNGDQGLGVQFNSVYWRNEWWSSTEKGTAPTGYSPTPQTTFGFSMFLDPDDSSEGMPQLMGDLGEFSLLNDGKPTYTYDVWNTKIGTETVLGQTYDVYKQYQVDEYVSNLTLAISSDGSEWECQGKWADGQINADWCGAEIWIKMTRNPFTYFADAPEQCFVAPKYMALSKTAIFVPETDHDGNSLYAGIQPEFQGDQVGFYYQRGGGEDVGVDNPLVFEGQELDSAMFRDEWWVRITLGEDFGPEYWYDLVWLSTRGIAVTLVFEFHMLVIGEWEVKTLQGDVPSSVPHVPVIDQSGFSNFLEGIGDWFGQLFDAFGFGLNMMFIFALVLAAVGTIAFVVLFWKSGKSEKSKGSSKKSKSKPARGGKYAGLSLFDWAVVLGVGVGLGLIPFDPTDVLDAGLPIVEPLLAFGYLFFKSGKNTSHGGKTTK